MVGRGVRAVDVELLVDLVAVDEDALTRRRRAQQEGAQVEQEDGVDQGQRHSAHDGGRGPGGVRGVAGEGETGLAVHNELEEEIPQVATNGDLVGQ